MRNIVTAFLVTLCLAASAPSAEKPARPFPEIERVLIVSIDGLRPDLLLRGDTPTLHGLLDTGTFTFWARTTEMSITLPSHVSMLTGVPPAKHGVVWNKEAPTDRSPYPDVPTLFEIAHKYGYTCALATGKSKFDTFNRAGALDWDYIPDKAKTTNDDVVQHASQIIKAHQPQVMFVHFPGVDSAGHAYGWGSPQQMAEIKAVDKALGQIITATKLAKTFNHTLLIVTADHGGQGRVHGPNDVRSRHIPWIAAGPGIRQNYDLTRIPSLTVNTEDTFATACFVLGLPIDRNVDGKSVFMIFDAPMQLLVDSPR